MGSRQFCPVLNNFNRKNFVRGSVLQGNRKVTRFDQLKCGRNLTTSSNMRPSWGWVNLTQPQPLPKGKRFRVR
jgi:hypothetical protein